MENKKRLMTRRIQDEVKKQIDDGTINKKGKKRKFNLPFMTKLKAQGAWKKRQMLVLLLRGDRVIQPVFGEMDEGILKIGEERYNGHQSFVMLWKGKRPCMVVRDWNVNPIGTKGKRNIDAETIILRSIEAKEAGEKKKINVKVWIWIALLGLIAAYALFYKGG